MSKKKSKGKDTSIHLEDKVRAFAKKRGLDEDSTLELWELILDNDDINALEDETVKNETRIKLLKVKIAEQQSKSRPTQVIEGIMLGLEGERLWNVDIIKSVLDAYQKTEEAPTDDQNRPRVLINKKGEPQVVAYNKAGRAYPMKVRKERKMIFFGSPLGSEAPEEMASITIGGELTIDGKKEFVIDQIENFPRGQKVRMQVEVGETYVNISKNPINDNGYFEVIDKDVDFDELFEDENMEKEYVDFDDIDDYITNNNYTPFWTEVVVANIGEVGDYGTIPVGVMNEPSGSFDDVDGDIKTFWINEEIPINYEIRSKLRVCLTGYLKKSDQSVQYVVSGVYPLNPVEANKSKELKKKASGKTPEKIDLFD